MTEFSYDPPKSVDFMYTLRKYLQETCKQDVAILLTNSTCEFFSSGSFSNRRWNSYDATVRFFVPVSRISKFTQVIQQMLLDAVDIVFPKEVGFEIVYLEISPIIETPPDDE